LALPMMKDRHVQAGGADQAKLRDEKSRCSRYLVALEMNSRLPDATATRKRAPR
jgi:hypothetical protein